MSIDVIYTAESTASGGGRDGHVKSSDNRIDLDTRPPKAAGGIDAHLIGYLPGLEQGQAEELMNKAHQVCPYSKATRGNIDVTLTAKV